MKDSIYKIFIVFVLLGISLLLYLFPKQSKLNIIKSATYNNTEINLNVDYKILNKETKLLFLGDIMLARSIGEKIQSGRDPFEYVKETFSSYDLVIGNLETSIGDKGQPQAGKLYTFQAPTESVASLSNAGIDIVSLANNHVMDYGDAGFTQMVELLKVKNIKYFGGGLNEDEAFSPLVLELNGNTIYLFGFNDVETSFNSTRDATPGNAWFNKARIMNLLDQADKKGAVVIPYVHWGQEFSFTHNARQQEFGRAMIDSGADIVVGSHPHVIQPSETYKSSEIVYSLGNYIFDLMYQDAAKGNMLEIIINNNIIVSSKLIPISIDQDGFAQLSKH